MRQNLFLSHRAPPGWLSGKRLGLMASVERNDNFLAKARKLSILSTSLDIFDIRQHYIRILYILSQPPDIIYPTAQSRQSLLFNTQSRVLNNPKKNALKTLWEEEKAVKGRDCMEKGEGLMSLDSARVDRKGKSIRV